MRGGLWVVIAAIVALMAWSYFFPEWMNVGIHFGR
jgi:hypothetical protein